MQNSDPRPEGGYSPQTQFFCLQGFSCEWFSVFMNSVSLPRNDLTRRVWLGCASLGLFPWASNLPRRSYSPCGGTWPLTPSPAPATSVRLCASSPGSFSLLMESCLLTHLVLQGRPLLCLPSHHAFPGPSSSTLENAPLHPPRPPRGHPRLTPDRGASRIAPW